MESASSRDRVGPRIVLVVLVALIAATIAALLAGPKASAIEPGEGPDPKAAAAPRFEEGVVLASFEKGATEDQKKKAKGRVKAKSKKKVFGTEIEVLEVAGKTEDAVAELENEPGVEYAQPNYVYTADYSANDPLYTNGSQYPLKRIKAYGAWQNALGEIDGTRNPEIGIIDSGWDNSSPSGYDSGHPDLKGKVTAEYDCLRNDASANDENGHGTHVAGIAAASTNNGTGIAGVAPGADLFVGRVLDGSGNGTTDKVIECANRAVAAGVEVLNFSMSTTAEEQAFRDAVERWTQVDGVNVVAAVGNNNGCPSAARYPASYPGVIGVGATNSNNARAAFSDCGSRVDVVAPGVDVMSSHLGGYKRISGTSQATPHVAGILALVRSNGYSSLQAQSRVLNTAIDLGPAGADIYYGRGLVDADAATGPN